MSGVPAIGPEQWCGLPVSIIVKGGGAKTQVICCTPTPTRQKTLRFKGVNTRNKNIFYVGDEDGGNNID